MNSIETARVHIRWMIRRDIAEVLRIDRLAGGLGWNEDELLLTLRERNCIGMVAERGEIVVGHFVYVLSKHKFQIRNMCVHPEWQRGGVGVAMIEKLKLKLSKHQRKRIVADVPESCLSMQLFLRSQGFRAIAIAGEVYRFNFDRAIKE